MTPPHPLPIVGASTGTSTGTSTSAGTSPGAAQWDGTERRTARSGPDTYAGPRRRLSDYRRSIVHTLSYHGPDRRTGAPSEADALLRSYEALANAVGAMDERLDAGAARMARIDAALATLAATQQQQAEQLQGQGCTLAEVRDLLTLGRNGFRVLGWLGTGSLWLIKAAGAFGLAVGALYGAWYSITHGGTLPPKP